MSTNELLLDDDTRLRQFISRMMKVPSFDRNIKSLMGDDFEWHHVLDPSKTKIDDLQCAMELLGFIKSLLLQGFIPMNINDCNNGQAMDWCNFLDCGITDLYVCEVSISWIGKDPDMPSFAVAAKSWLAFFILPCVLLSMAI